MTNDVIEIETRAAVRLGRELLDEVRAVLEDQGRREPILRIEVCRLLGKVIIHCVPIVLTPTRGD